ncbi:MAG: DUF4920 domain-containing protein [Chromatiales bacterium]|nr:MAG: DUF4920 domain-containing protein [Chromatiales bacterium]
MPVHFDITPELDLVLLDGHNPPRRLLLSGHEWPQMRLFAHITANFVIRKNRGLAAVFNALTEGRLDGGRGPAEKAEWSEEATMEESMKQRFTLRIAALAIGFFAAGASLGGEQTDVMRLSEPVVQTADSETFGSPLDDAVPTVSLEQIAGDGERFVGRSVRVEARVSEVCQKKGCFFIAQAGSSIVRVSFRDYAFFVPTDISGKRVMFVGEVVAKEITPEAAEHFAEDIGKKVPVMEPGMTYEIVASSVRVPRG